MSELKPGLYRATVRGKADQIVMVDDSGDYAPASSLTSVDKEWVHRLENITDAYPLLILDLKDLVNSGRIQSLVSHLRNGAWYRAADLIDPVLIREGIN